VELIQVITADGVRLDGALRKPTTTEPGAPIDAWLLIHGTGSNFYSSKLLSALEPRLAQSAAVLRVNTRGHDLVATGAAAGRRWQGAAFERVDEAPLDLAAWVEWLQARGYLRIGLLGHSLGAVKAIYWLAASDVAPTAAGAICALVAASPPRLSYAHYAASERAAEFLTTFQQAQALVQAGQHDELLLVRFPLPYWVSAAAYVDRYGPHERYNVLGSIERVGVPLLVSYGSRELQTDVAFRGMPEAIELLGGRERRQVAVIAGGDHSYSTVELTLADRVDLWLRRHLAGPPDLTVPAA
jgi:pimeloyl-ACP methyl ester carboxylesterase